MGRKSEVYASGTSVPAERTRAEIEELLRKHKARSTAVFTSEDEAAIAFEMCDRRVLFKIGVSPGNTEKARRETRERWRALLLSIKAKLISVQSGIETFEDAFMAHVVMPDGSTVADNVRPRIAAAYSEQTMVPLLPGPRPS